ncbi:MAG: molybdopterin molybdotransferase MoeA, partial [Eggerthellaceae bacterium]|nr:molybdopterin molybdotransferase MoeA [Eggerthellaceae bacterium]
AKPVAPGENIVFRHDDVKPGQVLIPAGTTLQAHHVGTLASLGLSRIDVVKRQRVAVISTGDEIVNVDEAPVASQMRDVNAPMLAAAVRAAGAEAVRFPIVPDEYEALRSTVEDALSTCDMVLVSGGSSAGQKDNTARVLSSFGELLFHGVAVKPGKPTMCADAGCKPAFGLPGHPVAAYFMYLELVRPLLAPSQAAGVVARLAAGVPSNHGRAELAPVRLEPGDGRPAAVPVRGKSGLISQLSGADGYVEIGRNQEGLAAGAEVAVKLF